MVKNTKEIDEFLLDTINAQVKMEPKQKEFLLNVLRLNQPDTTMVEDDSIEKERENQKFEEAKLAKITKLYVGIGDRKHAFLYHDEIRAFVLYTKTKATHTRKQIVDMAEWLVQFNDSKKIALRSILRMTHSPAEDVYVITMRFASIEDLEPQE